MYSETHKQRQTKKIKNKKHCGVSNNFPTMHCRYVSHAAISAVYIVNNVVYTIIYA